MPAPIRNADMVREQLMNELEDSDDDHDRHPVVAGPVPPPVAEPVPPPVAGPAPRPNIDGAVPVPNIADPAPRPVAAIAPVNVRQRKRPLADLIRENQEAYNVFITKKVPKLLRELGISSDSE